MVNTVALVGFPNCGKSTLFNRLTGSNQHIGNFPGVTVEKKSGALRLDSAITVVDLPGLYSLCPYTEEERVARDFLLDTPPDVVVHVVDATNPSRHLFLTLQLLTLGIPMVLALNLMDEARAAGRTYDLALLEQRLGIPVVPVSAALGEGIESLAASWKSACPPCRVRFPETADAVFLQAMEAMVRPLAQKANLPTAFAAECIVLGERSVQERLAPSDSARQEWQTHLQTWDADPAARLTEARYHAADRICQGATNAPAFSTTKSRTERADRVLTHPLFAIPIFLAVLFGMFVLTFSIFGAFFQDLMSLFLAHCADGCRVLLSRVGCNDLLSSLLVDGILTGVGGVLTFLPTILVLFFFLSLLEDSGYLARVAFVLDRPMRRIGLSGKALVSVLLGLGCTVPAVLSARTVSSRRERMLTILLLPFVICSAKIPMLTLLGSACFARTRWSVLLGCYLFSISCGLLSTALLGKWVFRMSPQAFLLELPPYRLPSPQTVLLHMWQKAKEFLKKAFTVILLSTIAIWFLRTFGTSLRPVAQEDSLLAGLSGAIAVFLKPLGFGDWRLAAALLCGLCAKEATVSTLAVLLGAGEDAIGWTLRASGILPDTASALAFAVFFILYLPCIASLAAMRSELGSRRIAWRAFAYQLAVAWLLSFCTYQLLSLC